MGHSFQEGVEGRPGRTGQWGWQANRRASIPAPARVYRREKDASTRMRRPGVPKGTHRPLGRVLAWPRESGLAARERVSGLVRAWGQPGFLSRGAATPARLAGVAGSFV